MSFYQRFSKLICWALYRHICSIILSINLFLSVGSFPLIHILLSFLHIHKIFVVLLQSILYEINTSICVVSIIKSDFRICIIIIISFKYFCFVKYFCLVDYYSYYILTCMDFQVSNLKKYASLSILMNIFACYGYCCVQSYLYSLSINTSLRFFKQLS